MAFASNQKLSVTWAPPLTTLWMLAEKTQKTTDHLKSSFTFIHQRACGIPQNKQIHCLFREISHDQWERQNVAIQNDTFWSSLCQFSNILNRIALSFHFANYPTTTGVCYMSPLKHHLTKRLEKTHDFRPTVTPTTGLLLAPIAGRRENASLGRDSRVEGCQLDLVFQPSFSMVKCTNWWRHMEALL